VVIGEVDESDDEANLALRQKPLPPLMRCRAIRAHAGWFPVTLMCQTLAVSSSGYYAWVARPESRRTAEDRQLHTAQPKPFAAERLVHRYSPPTPYINSLHQFMKTMFAIPTNHPTYLRVDV
jgi:hypothetical protein